MGPDPVLCIWTKFANVWQKVKSLDETNFPIFRPADIFLGYNTGLLYHILHAMVHYRGSPSLNYCPRVMSTPVWQVFTAER